MMPRMETRPTVGLSPTMPHHAEGQRMLPPVSVPKRAEDEVRRQRRARSRRRSAGDVVEAQGLRVGPK